MSFKTIIMATIKILLRNKPNKIGEYPIVLRITKNRKSKIISLGINCDPKYWDKNKCEIKKAHGLNTQLNAFLVQKRMDAMKVIADFEKEKVDFSLEQFKRMFSGENSKDISVSQFWLEKIDDLIRSGRIGNARFHKCSYNSFFRFCNSKSIQFRDISLREVEKYEVFLLENNNTGGGIAAKMRALRAVFNDAVSKGIIDAKYSPFISYKVSKHKGKNLKKALSREQVKAIESFDLIKYPHLKNARHFFVFSYYARGMNFMDMMQLRWGEHLKW
jgi:integrase/recombinase XerD